MEEKIKALLEEKVGEVYQHFQKELGIESGRTSPMQLFVHEELLGKLAAQVCAVLKCEMQQG